MNQINVVAGRRGGGERGDVRVAEAAFNEGGEVCGPIKKKHKKKKNEKQNSNYAARNIAGIKYIYYAAFRGRSHGIFPPPQTTPHPSVRPPPLPSPTLRPA